MRDHREVGEFEYSICAFEVFKQLIAEDGIRPGGIKKALYQSHF
ncbi:hypothetical protein V12B01_24524 [Vibrio splendidus 12B01]|nr:hypothetical protein V12B01_24524 [Vibrio splendidus 12B01]